MRKFFIGITTVLMIVFSPVSLAFADTVSVNFENPPYVLGSINNQDGWTSLGSVGSGCAVYDHAVASQSAYLSFGNQSLRISDAATSGCFGDQTFAKPLVNAVGETAATAGSFSEGTRQRHFEMQFDIGSTSSLVQPGMHVSVSPDRGDGSRMSYLRFEDSALGINVFFDDVQQPGPCSPSGCANFVETQVGTDLSRLVPHKIKLTLDTLDGPGNDVVKVYIDSTLVKTGTSWEDYYRYDPESSAEQSPRIVKTVIFRTSGTASPLDQGNGFLFDNFSSLSGPILVGPPTDKNQCKNGGWKTFNNPSFKNQGQCISFVENHQNQNGDGGKSGNNNQQIGNNQGSN